MGRTLFSTLLQTRNSAKSEPVFTIGGNLDNLYVKWAENKAVESKIFTLFTI